MLLGKEPQFVKQLGAIWHSVTHIPDLTTLKRHMVSSTLVALDIEGHVTKINEIGLATVSISEAKPLNVPKDGSLNAFYDQNEVRAHTIIIWEERAKRKYEAIKYGDQVIVHNDEMGKALHEVLSMVDQCSGHLILVGYDMYKEFDWISRACPSFLSRFKYWVDVQEIVQESCGSRPSLLNTLGVMKIIDRSPTKSPPHGHRASNDTVRTLAVLSHLVLVERFDYEQPRRTKLCSTAPRNWKNFPIKARITTRDESILPACIKTPRALSLHFAKYHPTVVLINSRAAALKGVRVWWICLPTEDLLDELTADLDGSITDGKQLQVQKVVASWLTERHGRLQNVEEENVC